MVNRYAGNLVSVKMEGFCGSWLLKVFIFLFQSWKVFVCFSLSPFSVKVHFLVMHLHLPEQPCRSSAAAAFTRCVTCKSRESKQMDTQTVWVALLIKSSSCSWPSVAVRTLFWHWQFIQQDRAAIYHPWQVKPCAQSVYIYNYKASSCLCAVRVQEHLLGEIQQEVRRSWKGLWFYIRWE